ncbi:MAG: hypothetical protein E7256_08145 [Lachnospiraceae bacterium]|nr:hypothetical protein [Lachnospiraceae bacterium]
MKQFHIVEKAEKASFITNVHGSVDAEDTIVIAWSYPKDLSYPLCVIYDVESSFEPLESLIKRQPLEIYTVDMGRKHWEKLSRRYRQFKLFPAYQKGEEYYILNQKEGNATEKFVKKSDIIYTIKEERGLFEHYKKVTVKFRTEKDLYPEWLKYTIVGRENSFLYTLDLNAFPNGDGAIMYLKPEETVVFELTKEQKPYFNLRRILL